MKEIWELVSLNNVIFQCQDGKLNQEVSSSDSMPLSDGREQSKSDSSLPCFRKRDSLSNNQSPEMLAMVNYIKALRERNEEIAKKLVIARRENKEKDGEIERLKASLAKAENNNSRINSLSDFKPNVFCRSQSSPDLSAILPKS